MHFNEIVLLALLILAMLGLLAFIFWWLLFRQKEK